MFLAILAITALKPLELKLPYLRKCEQLLKDISLHANYERYSVAYNSYAMFDRSGSMACFELHGVLYAHEVPCTQAALRNLIRPSLVKPSELYMDLEGCLEVNSAFAYNSNASIGTTYTRFLMSGNTPLWICYRMAIIDKIPHPTKCITDGFEKHSIDPTEFIFEQNGTFYYKPPTIIEFVALRRANASSVASKDYDYEHN